MIIKQKLQKSKFQLSKGVTLIELLLYMGILSIFLMVLTDLFVAILSSRTETEAVSAVEQDGRFIISRLAYDVHRAQAITIPATAGQTTTSLVVTIDGNTYTYALTNGELKLTDSLGTVNLTSSETTIPSISFQKIGNGQTSDTVVITFILNSVAQRSKGVESKVFKTTIGRRQ